MKTVLAVDPGSATAGVAIVQVSPDRPLYSEGVLLSKFKKEYRTREHFFGYIDTLLRKLVGAVSDGLIPAYKSDTAEAVKRGVAGAGGRENALLDSNSSIDLIACESAHVDYRYPQAGLAISECIGVVRRVAAETRIPVRMVSPAEWKKGITGNAGADYRLALICLCSQLQVSLGDLSEHEIAAISIGLTAGRIAETESKLEANNAAQV